MNQRIKEQLEETYRQRRQTNEITEQRRRREIAERLPEVETLLNARHEMILSAVKRAFAGSAENAEEQMARYNREIAEMLTRHGYPADYLSPVFTCAKCQDQGYYYDASSRKQTCECYRQAFLQALSAADELNAGEDTFENFDLNRFPTELLPNTDLSQRDYMDMVRAKCQLYAQSIPEGRQKTLLLHGSSGLGKTFLLHCIDHEARSRGVEVLYVTAFDLLMDLKNAYFSRTGETAGVYFDTALLLIDDLGMEPMIENITVEQIFNLLNSRLNRGLYTAVSTNLNRTELKQKYTERVSSRLLDTRSGLAIQLLGRDIRLIK